MRTRLAKLGLALALVPVTVVLAGVPASAARSCNGERVTILGTRGDDDLRGTSRDDVILGLGGDDVLRGAGGSDVLCGSSGNDRLLGGGGDDVVLGDDGNDELEGGGGVDEVSYARSPNGVKVDLIAGTVKGWGNDTVEAIENIVGSGHDDNLRAGRGAATIAGGDGNDVLTGSGASDILEGGDGDDRIEGGPGQANVATYARAPQAVEVDLAAGRATGWGSDTLSGIQVVVGTDFDDTLTGSTQRNVFQPGAGDDTIVGAGSGDVVDFTAAPAGVVVDLGAGTATGDGADTLSSIASVNGSAFADTLTGDQRRNILNGAAGDDTIAGNEGPDALDGGEGTDSLDGGQGDDTCLNGETVVECEG